MRSVIEKSLIADRPTGEKKHENSPITRSRDRTSAGRGTNNGRGNTPPRLAQEKPNQGEVVAVGSGRVLDSGETRAVDVSIGDTVVFGKYAGSDTIELDGEELVILSESDIKAVIG